MSLFSSRLKEQKCHVHALQSRPDLFDRLYYLWCLLVPGHLIFKLFLLLFNLGWGRSCAAWPCHAATVNKKEWNLMLQQEQCRTAEPSGLRNPENSLSSWTLLCISYCSNSLKQSTDTLEECIVDVEDDSKYNITWWGNCMYQASLPDVQILTTYLITDKWNKALISTNGTLYLFLDKHLFGNLKSQLSSCHTSLKTKKQLLYTCKHFFV